MNIKFKLRCSYLLQFRDYIIIDVTKLIIYIIKQDGNLSGQ